MKKKIGEQLFPNYKDDKAIISSELFTDERPSYICSICNQTLIRLTDSSLQNTAFWCRNCSVEFNPEEENVRRESKLTVPDRNEETLVSNTPLVPDVSIRKEVEIKGGLKELQKKGMKIRSPRPRRPLRILGRMSIHHPAGKVLDSTAIP